MSITTIGRSGLGWILAVDLIGDSRYGSATALQLDAVTRLRPGSAV